MASAIAAGLALYDAARWNQAETHFSKIKDAIDNKPLTFDCGCKQSYFCLRLSGPAPRSIPARASGRHPSPGPTLPPAP